MHSRRPFFTTISASQAMNVSDPYPPDAGWLHRAGRRALTWWPAKLVGMTLGLTIFFVAYFWLLRHPLHPITIMPLTTVDRVIGFWPGALPLYLSLWFYLSVALALLIERRELVAYWLGAVGLSVLGLGIFLLWPTAVPLSAVDWSQHPAFTMLKSVDASGNACPSLHVAFAVFSAVWLEHLLRQMRSAPFLRGLNWLWCLGILYSTIAVRQHVALDVLGGIVLGAIVAVVNMRLLRVFSIPRSAPPTP